MYYYKRTGKRHKPDNMVEALLRPQTNPEIPQTMFVGDVDKHNILASEGSAVMYSGTLTEVDCTERGCAVTIFDSNNHAYTKTLPEGSETTEEALNKFLGGSVIASSTIFGNELVTFSVNRPHEQDDIIPTAAD